MTFRRLLLATARCCLLGSSFSKAFSSHGKRALIPRSRLFGASSSSSPSSLSSPELTTKTPIHLLAGFLGSGKTTTLSYLLNNTENAKIGVVVNDVAAVNIDAKLVSKDKTDNFGGIVKLENGCACCSLAGEFVDSIENLLNNTSRLDAVVVELSGVADPVAVQNTWREAVRSGHVVTSKAEMKNVVTVVDACTFGTDYFTWDISRDREDWVEQQGDCSGNRQVTMLLVEQIEGANLVLVNKIDLAEKEQVTVCSKMMSSLNDKATVIQTAMGKVSPALILKDYDTKVDDSGVGDESASVSHDHHHEHRADCSDPDCTDTSHSHSHNHDSQACTDPGCTDTSHSHSHDHESAHSHSYSHDHDGNVCKDPDCTDTSHSHSHDHESSIGMSTDELGITNFVYKADRPFDAMKIQQLLLQWPIETKKVLDLEALRTDGSKQNSEPEEEASPFKGVLRSKGFCWFSPTSWDGLLADPWRHNAAMYWSHAGKHMGIQEAGIWWSSIPNYQESMKEFFVDNPAEGQRILREDFVTEEFGDRRQEIVFIGVGIDPKAITESLNSCLLTDEEMETYRQRLAQLEEAAIATSSQ